VGGGGFGGCWDEVPVGSFPFLLFVVGSWFEPLVLAMVVVKFG